ncbi:MAG TPA: tetratricopeptide repeat protein [Pirellulales bacterium]|nr:tetratricopeptide repeat protein [Pirellulales bacterium]
MHGLVFRFALPWLLLTNISLAAEDATKRISVGNMVMPKLPGVQFRIKSQGVEEMSCGVIERVQKVQGDWLWLGRGWVRRPEVVSLVEAAGYFTAEIERKPTAFAYVARAAAKGWPDGLNSESNIDLDRALKLDAEFAAAHRLRGEAFCERHEWDSAINAFDEAIRCGPTVADAYDGRGRAWYDKAAAWDERGRAWYDPSHKDDMSFRQYLEKALSDFDRAIRICPRLAKAYCNRAAVFLTKNEYERALAEARESLKHDPAASAAYRLIGACWMAKGDGGEALSAFNKAVRLNPECGKARFGRAQTYLRQGEEEKALADLDRAIELVPKNASALSVRAQIFYRRGEIEKSRADRLAAARLERTASAPTAQAKGRGESLAKSEKSTDDINNIVGHLGENDFAVIGSTSSSDATARPSSTLVETPRGRAQTLDVVARRRATSTDERYLDGERAVEAATQACELSEWKLASFLDTLAAAYAEAGNFDAAVNWQTKAMELGNIGPTLEREAEQRLELYRAHKPCREEVPGRLARETEAKTNVR